MKNIATGAFISTDHFQQSLHPSPFLQASGATAPQPQHIFAMQPTAQFQPPTSCQPQHPQAHQMFVSANGQLMTATPMVSIAVPNANVHQGTISAATASGTTPAGCYGSPFQPFFMSQSPPGQPAGMVAWQPTAAWSAYQHAAAAAAAAAATASSASTQQYVQQQHQNQQAFSQNNQQHQAQTHAQQQQQQQQHFVFAGGQSGATSANTAAAYPQQLYLASAPGAC